MHNTLLRYVRGVPRVGNRWADVSDKAADAQANVNADIARRARCARGACLTKDMIFTEDGEPGRCRFCMKAGPTCEHPKGSWCTGCRGEVEDASEDYPLGGSVEPADMARDAEIMSE